MPNLVTTSIQSFIKIRNLQIHGNEGPQCASFYQGRYARSKGLTLQNQPSTRGFHKGPGTGQIDWCRSDFAHSI